MKSLPQLYHRVIKTSIRTLQANKATQRHLFAFPQSKKVGINRVILGVEWSS